MVHGHILLAEDNPVNQEIAISMLESLGCQGAVATSGREAIEALSRSRYDLVLMDCEMPDMDGFEAIRVIRGQEAGAAGRHIPIIALTAHMLEDIREQCLMAGMDMYLSKPFTREQLHTVLVRWLPRHVVSHPGRIVPTVPNESSVILETEQTTAAAPIDSTAL